MSSIIARITLGLVSLLTVTLSLWKSSALSHATYLHMEHYVGGSTTLHFTFSLLIGFFAVFAFPRSSSPNKTDIFGIRLLLCLLLVISLEEFSQLFITNRTFSIADLSTNWSGMLLGYFAAKAWQMIRNH
ncbi:VanZ family protein [Vibrio sp. EA2]|uniref:VanZ family protein n=1 Tax=Vibrio sp. EA2 TaxID=3079860 RepID=UPI002949136D|nr:VanZ family protein [Vibrio sp. EA2]MDV6252164.1 VanZ family protein [Vibrio sp. EA2]